MENGRCIATSLTCPLVSDNGLLYLERASSTPEFRPVYQALSDMGFYHINPRRLGVFYAPARDRMSARYGSHAAGVLADMKSLTPAIFERLAVYIGTVVPEIVDAYSTVIGNGRALEIHFRVSGVARPV